MGRMLVLLFIFFGFCTSCADPKYIGNTEIKGGLSKKFEFCQANFSDKYCVSGIQWEKKPTEEDVGSFLFKTLKRNLNENDAEPIDIPDGNLTVILWMPSMGHGSSPVRLERLDVGSYRAARVYFTMKGHWEIRFQVKNGEEVWDEAIIPIDL